MFARNPPRTFAGLTLLLAIVSVAWTSPGPLVEPGTRASASVAASNVGPEISISARDSEEHLPAIAYNSKHNEYLVVWENDWGGGYHDIYAQRISGSGQLLSWFALTTVHSQTNPAVAYDPDNDRYLVVWAYDSDGNGINWDVYGRFVRWNGPPDATAFPICDWPNNQGHPVVAYNGVRKEFLVVWKDTVSGNPSSISARRVLAAGGFPPGGAWTLSPTTPENRDSPDVAYNLHRNEYLVTWDIEINASDRDIRGIRLRGDGTALTGGSAHAIGEFIIADYIDAIEWTPAVAACGAADQYLVAWQSDDGPPTRDYAIYARYLSYDAVPGDMYKIDDTPYPQLNVDVDCNLAGDRYVLAWQSGYSSGKYGIWARFAWPNEYLPAQFLVQLPGSTTDRVFPAVAGGRTGALVAWEHQRDVGGNRDIHGRLLQYAVYLPLIRR